MLEPTQTGLLLEAVGVAGVALVVIVREREIAEFHPGSPLIRVVRSGGAGVVVSTVNERDAVGPRTSSGLIAWTSNV